MHAREGAERERVARVIDAYAASIADLVGAITMRPDQILDSATAWLRRWERLDPELVRGLVDMAHENPVVAELALRELAFAGAEPVGVLETLMRLGETRLAGLFGRMVLRSAPRRRRQRLERFLARGSAQAVAALEAMLAAGADPDALPARAPLDAVRARWLERLAGTRACRAERPLGADDTLDAALGGYARRLELELARLGRGGAAAAPTAAPPSVTALRDFLSTHPDPWVRLCAQKAPAGGDDMPSLIERVLFLKETPIFMEVEPPVLVHVAERLERRAYAPGERLVTAGQRSDGLHLIRSGQVEVVQRRGADTQRIATLGAPEPVGELSALNDTPATADCVAVTPVECYVVPGEALAHLLHEHPRLAIGIIRMLSERLIATTLRVREAQPATPPLRAAT